MSTLSLHLAIHTANIEIRKATRASDDYAYASTETLFNALWEIAPQVEYCDDLWNISLGGGCFWIMDRKGRKGVSTAAQNAVAIFLQ